MGTSNLYNGPKGKSLLPDGYIDPFAEDDEVEGTTDDAIDNADSNDQDTKDDVGKQDNNFEQLESPQLNTIGSWTTAKKSYNNLFKNSSSSNVHRAAKNYVEALGGYKRAAQQASKAKKVTSTLIELFGGGSNQVKRKLTELGISFDGRSTKEIFKEVLERKLLLPPSIRDNALANTAVLETYSDLLKSELFTPDSLDMFDKGALEFLICTYLKHYIFDKMIQEVSRKEFTKSIEEIKKIENQVYKYVSSCVDNIVPKYIKDINFWGNIAKKVNDIYKGCYKQLEEGLTNETSSSKDK